MTRINLIPVEELTDQHLLAEHREIKRIPNVIKSGKYNLKWIPAHYTMWTWHVKFFYNKLIFLLKRYWELRKECWERGFVVENYAENFLYNFDYDLLWDYTPTEKEIAISKERIAEKIKLKPSFYRHYWKPLLINN